MQRSRTSSGWWLLALPVLTGAAGGAVPMAAELVLLAAAVATTAVLWRQGGRATAGVTGWRLLAVAVAVGHVSRPAAALLADLGGASLPGSPGQLVLVPAAVLGALAVLRLAGRRRLRSGGARLLTESALFASASFVLAQILVVGPAVARELPRPVLELNGLLVVAVLTAVMVLIAVSGGARRTSGVLVLLSAVIWVAAHGLVVPGPALQWAAFDAGSAVELASLWLLCLAALRDPGAASAPAGQLPTRWGVSGPLLPHLVLLAAAVTYATAPSLGLRVSRAAGVALLCCVALTVVHRAVAARDEAAVARRLRRSEAHFRSLVRSSSDCVLVLDSDLRITWAAPRLEPAAGEPPLTGRRLPEVVDPEDAEEVRSWLCEPAPSGLRSFRLPDAAGERRVLEAGVSDLRADADVRALVLHCRDVTARLDRENQLSSLAFLDPLTGLPNRAAQRVAMHAVLDERTADVALLLVEVQGLAEAQERAGRDVLDVAVAEVARRLRGTVRAEDQVARVGPELFSVLAHGTGDEPDRLAARCLAVIEAPIPTDAGIVDLTAAVGVVPLTAGLSERTAVDRAELALLDARAAGPGSVRRYRAELTAARDRREQLRRDLLGARERGELGLAWQPIISLSESRVTGVEALLRWRHPEHGDVPPEEFLPLAECAGLAVDLQRWALREATAAAAALPAVDPELKLGVDVSARHLAAGTLVGDVAAALRDSGFPAERLVVEVPESALEAQHLADDATALRLMGVRLALDDFGSGRSSLAGLGRLPLDVIKLDRSLLARVDRDAHSRAICEAVVALGRSLRIDVVAQGVETTSQLSALRGLGCGFAQGFLLSRPIGLAELTELVGAGPTDRLGPRVTGRVHVSER